MDRWLEIGIVGRITLPETNIANIGVDLLVRCLEKVTKNTPPKFTLPETNSSHLKMDGWKMNFLLGWPIFRDHVSFRECISERIGWKETDLKSLHVTMNDSHENDLDNFISNSRNLILVDRKSEKSMFQ